MNNLTWTIEWNCKQIIDAWTWWSVPIEASYVCNPKLNTKSKLERIIWKPLSKSKISFLYSFDWTWDVSSFYLWNANWEKLYFFLNQKQVWIADNTTISWSDTYMYYNRRDIWVPYSSNKWKKKIYFDIINGDSKTEIYINGKKYFWINNWQLDISDWFKKLINIKWNLKVLSDKINLLQKFWILTDTGNKVKIFNLYIAWPWDYTINLYWFFWTKWWNPNAEYVWLKQVIILDWLYHFVEVPSNGTSQALNAYVNGITNYDDKVYYLSWINKKYIRDKYMNRYYVGKDIVIKKREFFTKHSLRFFREKMIYLRYNNVQKMYEVDNNLSYDIVDLIWLDFWDVYSFLNNCSYEEVINNMLGDCTDWVLKAYDVDNDWWNE